MVVDLDAIAANTAVLRERVGRPLMAVVKADGYGHGLVPAARAVLAGGADALGVAVLDEALALRAAGITAPLLAWLHGPGTDFAAALAADVEVSVERRLGAGRGGRRGPRHRPRRPGVHLKVDTGLSPRRAPPPADWPGLVAAAARAQADGEVEVVGLWSHMAYADAPTHPTDRPRRCRCSRRPWPSAGRAGLHRRPPAPGQLRGHGRAARTPGSTSSARASPCTGSTRSAATRSRARSAPGDDGAGRRSR